MRNIGWKIECRNIFVLLAIAALVGWLLGAVAWTMLLAAIVYILWIIRQLRRILTWIEGEDGSPPPESRGIFGRILDDVYRLQRLSLDERKRLQAQVQYLRDSFASLEDAAIMLDENGSISWCNKAAVELLGLRYPGDQGRQLTNLIRNPAFVSYFDDTEYAETLQMRSPVNDNLELLINITFFGAGNRLMLARDITQANRLQQMRKDFVANVSHELRTPLTVISGYLETLSDHRPSDELSWRRILDQMLSQSRRMEDLIKDLTALSRLESSPKRAEHATIELRPMLEMIREEAMASVPDRHGLTITINCDEALLLQGNATEVHSAINNLVVNAAKYCGDNGTVTIRWYKDKRAAYLQVEDNGEGIEAHHLPRLTERFYRVDKSRSLDTGGTGLGLAIVKHVLLHHQAELQIESVIGQGSVFTCVFPLIRTTSHSCSA